jgi:hypothetical protein
MAQADPSLDASIRQAARLVLAAEYVTALTGASISVEALVGFQGRGCAEGVQPDFCHSLIMGVLIFQ